MRGLVCVRDWSDEVGDAIAGEMGPSPHPNPLPRGEGTETWGEGTEGRVGVGIRERGLRGDGDVGGWLGV